jgi:transketolase
MLKTVVGAAKALAEEGVSARVLSMYTVKPLDTDAVLQAVMNVNRKVTHLIAEKCTTLTSVRPR